MLVWVVISGLVSGMLGFCLGYLCCSLMVMSKREQENES